jgi:hypothetical protein
VHLLLWSRRTRCGSLGTSDRLSIVILTVVLWATTSQCNCSGSGVDMQMQGLAIVVRVSRAQNICGLSVKSVIFVNRQIAEDKCMWPPLAHFGSDMIGTREVGPHPKLVHRTVVVTTYICCVFPYVRSIDVNLHLRTVEDDIASSMCRQTFPNNATLVECPVQK